ncbi:MAG: minor capsid protein, partial [Bacteroidaceae bacterium]|nr:minor capsid protein [Bacteroidaceae bacterium]
MDKFQKEVVQSQLNNEKACLDALKETYQNALNDVNIKLAELLGRGDADMQHVIYQVQYQEALKDNIEASLKMLQTQNFENISEYLTKSYEEGYLGSIYDMQKKGIPLIFPIDQAQVVEAITHDTKLSTDLYTALGKDVNKLKKDIASEISRGISTNMTYKQIADSISRYVDISKNNATRIARTEGHRISSKATMDACTKAKDKGADIVKQWDATLDGKTRPSHRQVDGEVRELEETFSNGLMYPSDPSGEAKETINCRCVLLQMPRSAVGSSFTKSVTTDDGTQV